MGLLFDAVKIKAGKGALFLSGEKLAEVAACEATMICGDEVTPFTEEQYAYLRGGRSV